MITTVGALILATVCGTVLAQPGMNFLGLDPSSSSTGANQPVFNVGNINQDPTASSSSGLTGLRFDSMGGGSGGGLDSHLNLGNQQLGNSAGLGMGGGLGDLGGMGSMGSMGNMGSFGGPSPSLGNQGFGRGLLGQRSNSGGGFGRGGGNMWGQQQQMPLLMLMMNQMFW